jgi:hypothetical protein
MLPWQSCTVRINLCRADRGAWRCLQEYERALKYIFPACSKVVGRHITQTLTILDLQGGMQPSRDAPCWWDAALPSITWCYAAQRQCHAGAGALAGPCKADTNLDVALIDASGRMQVWG